MHLSSLAAPTVIAAALVSVAAACPQTTDNAPLPDPRKLVQEAREHQLQVDKVTEAYTYSSLQTVQDIDAKVNITKTETSENEYFFVNQHIIERTNKKHRKPPNEPDQQK